MIQTVVDQIWADYDTNDNGYLEEEEAFAFIKKTLGELKELNKEAIDAAEDDEAMKEAFNEFDKDENGRLSKTEMVHFIRQMINKY